MGFIPKKFKQYFWDVEIGKLTKNNKEQILNRLLEYGDKNAYSWCSRHFTQEEIVQCLKHSRALSKKSANFWAFIFDIPKNQILCLNKSYRQKHRKLWKY
jgi:hypothetical protein